MSIEARFLAFHNANPAVYAELVKLARQARSIGRSKIGIGMLWEVLRWNVRFALVSIADGYKLNNNHRSRYARMIHKREPDLRGIFELRELRS